MSWFDSRLSFKNLKKDQFQNWVTQVTSAPMDLHMRSKQYIYKIPIMGHTHKFFRGKLLYVLRCPSDPWPLCLTKIFLFLFLRLAASLFCLDGFAASTTTCLERVPFHLGAEDQVPEHGATPHHSKWRKGTHHQH